MGEKYKKISDLLEETSQEIGKEIKVVLVDWAKPDNVEKYSQDYMNGINSALFEYPDNVTILIPAYLSQEYKRMVLAKELRHLNGNTEVDDNITDLIDLLVPSVWIEAKKPNFLLASSIVPLSRSSEGILVKSISNVWNEIVDYVGNDWSNAQDIPYSIWEEVVAGAFHKARFDEVTLTPRSGDLGRDVIAIKHGVGSIKILGSVKAYAPDNAVSYDDIRALIGVLSSERDASKGMLITTSRFPPNLHKDKLITPLIPNRLELLDGEGLRDWLVELRKPKSEI